MTHNIEIAAKLFKSIANNAKTFDKGIRNNPLSMKAVFVAYAESAAIAAKADKGKNEIMRIEMTKRGLPMFWTKQGDKHNQTPALKMELSAIKICTDNAMHELSDDDFCSIKQTCLRHRQTPSRKPASRKLQRHRQTIAKLMQTLLRPKPTPAQRKNYFKISCRFGKRQGMAIFGNGPKQCQTKKWRP